MDNPHSVKSLIAQAWQQAFVDASASYQCALQALDNCEPEGENAAWAHWLLALAESNRSNTASARSFMLKARAWFVKHQSVRGQALCAELDASLALQSGDTVRASLMHRALDGARSAEPKPIDRFYAHFQRGMLAKHFGQWELASRHFEAAWELADISGNAGAVAQVRNQIGGLELVHGKLEDAETHCQHAFKSAQALGARETANACAANLIVICDALGDQAGSVALADALVDAPRGHQPGEFTAMALPLALSYFRRGDSQRAEAWLEAAAGTSHGSDAVFWSWLTARCLMERGEHTLAADLAERTLVARKDQTPPFHLVHLLETLSHAHGELGQSLKSLRYREAANRVKAGADHLGGDLDHPIASNGTDEELLAGRSSILA